MMLHGQAFASACRDSRGKKIAKKP